MTDCIGNYKKIYLSEQFVLSNDRSNKWFLTKCAQIVEMINITFNEGILSIYGKPIKTKNAFFKKPFLSSHMDIYSSNKPTFDTARLFKINTIKCKLFSINLKNEVVFIPLLHTLQ